VIGIISQVADLAVTSRLLHRLRMVQGWRRSRLIR
jgi:hypothetical protein